MPKPKTFLNSKYLAFVLYCFTTTNKKLTTQAFTLPKHTTTTTTSSSTTLPISTTNDQTTTPTTTSSTYISQTTQTDLNQYNLPPTTTINEWTAEITPPTALLDSTVTLNVRNKRDYFVDTLQFPIKRDGGMGLILTEIAGGNNDDGLGITVVTELIKGSNADGCGIIEGDSIVKVEVLSETKVSMNDDNDNNNELEDPAKNMMMMMTSTETTESHSVSTECLDYDTTISALSSLPPPSTTDVNSMTAILTIKRIRRKPKINLTLEYPPYTNEPPVTIELFSGENLRRAMLTRGVKLNDALSRRFDSGGMGDCGAEGTCATCVVDVRGDGGGMDLLSEQGVQEKQILRKNPRWRLACKAVVGAGMTEGDLKIRVNPRQWD